MRLGQLGEADFSFVFKNSSLKAVLEKVLALSKASCFCLANSEAGMTVAFNNLSWAVCLNVLAIRLEQESECIFRVQNS